MPTLVIPRPPDPQPPPADTVRLRELYDHHAKDLYRLAYRLTGTRADAEDVVQDVFVGLPEALRSYQERGREGPWLRRVTVRVALARIRGGTRKREVPLEAGAEPSVRAAADAVVDRLALYAALDRLPEPLRMVLVLKELEGYSHAEIAELLGIREGTSQVRLHRAHDKLRHLLGSPS